MKVFFDAWLDQGEPRVRIVDCDTGHVRLNWRYQRFERDAASLPLSAESADPECAARLALHQLVRKLFLLSCADRMHSVGPAFDPGARCTGCCACLIGESSPQAAANDD